jgi:hypothetical protein
MPDLRLKNDDIDWSKIIKPTSFLLTGAVTCAKYQGGRVRTSTKVEYLRHPASGNQLPHKLPSAQIPIRF